MPTVIVIVELPAPGAGIVLGLKLTVVPAGAPAADNPMEPLKPPLIVVVIVEVPCDPCATLTEDGAADTVKLADPDPWLNPRYAIVVRSPLHVLVPTATVSCVPVRVACCVRLLVGQDAADQLFPLSS